MKSLKVLFLALVLTVSTVTFTQANNPIPNPIPNTNKVIGDFISKKLASADLVLYVDGNEDVRIAFQITDDNEIVVMKTSAKEDNLDRYIKSKLNYKELDLEGLQYNKTYFITVEFVEQ